MKEVGVLEAKTNLSALLSEVETTGQPIAITRHGRRIADLAPPPAESLGGLAEEPARPWSDVVREITEWREDLARRNPAFREPYDLRADRDSIE